MNILFSTIPEKRECIYKYPTISICRYLMQLYTSIIFNLTVNLVQEGYKLKCAMIICLFYFWCALPWIFGKAPAFEADDSGVEANFFSFAEILTIGVVIYVAKSGIQFKSFLGILAIVTSSDLHQILSHRLDSRGKRITILAFMDGMGICNHMQASRFKNPWNLISGLICHVQISEQIKSSVCAPIG